MSETRYDGENVFWEFEGRECVLSFFNTGLFCWDEIEERCVRQENRKRMCSEKFEKRECVLSPFHTGIFWWDEIWGEMCQTSEQEENVFWKERMCTLPFQYRVFSMGRYSRRDVWDKRTGRRENSKRMCSENYRFEERCVRQERTGRDIVLGIWEERMCSLSFPYRCLPMRLDLRRDVVLRIYEYKSGKNI